MKNSLMMVMAELKKFNGRSGTSMEREDVISRYSQLFVEGGGFEVPNSIQRRINHQSTGELANWKSRHLEFPVFSGDDPDGWVAKMERCHEYLNLSEVDKLEMAVVGLEGDALHWFQWRNKWQPITMWRNIRRTMFRRFRGRRGGSLIEQWLTVSQDGTDVEYEKKFIQLASIIEEEMSEECLIAHFIRGLERKVGSEVKVLDPVTMEEALEMALRVEENLLVEYGLGGSGGSYNHTRNYQINPKPTNVQNNHNSNHAYIVHKDNPKHNPYPNFPSNKKTTTHDNTRRLSDKEF